MALSYPYTDWTQGAFPEHRAVAERAKPGYVRVTIYEKGGGSGNYDFSSRKIVIASGIVVDKQGYLVTAAHIAKSKAYGARITTVDGRIHEAKILHVDPDRELALLHMWQPPGTTPAEFTDSDALKRGAPVLAIGSPDGKAGIVSVGRVRIPKRKGRVKYGAFGFDSGIELKIEVETGHSGGPAFDADGRLIGMVASYLLGDTTKTPYKSPAIAFVVPANDIRDYVAENRR